MSKKITLLGSTGSIGTQSLDVIRAQGYEVFGLSAHSHVDKILQQIEEFHPRYVHRQGREKRCATGMRYHVRSHPADDRRVDGHCVGGRSADGHRVCDRHVCGHHRGYFCHRGRGDGHRLHEKTPDARHLFRYADFGCVYQSHHHCGHTSL